MPLRITVNGEAREIDALPSFNLEDLLRAWSLNPLQVAIEQNGEIVRRGAWQATAVREGDRFEIVQFVGGGISEERRASGALLKSTLR